MATSCSSADHGVCHSRAVIAALLFVLSCGGSSEHSSASKENSTTPKPSAEPSAEAHVAKVPEATPHHDAEPDAGDVGPAKVDAEPVPPAAEAAQPIDAEETPADLGGGAEPVTDTDPLPPAEPAKAEKPDAGTPPVDAPAEAAEPKPERTKVRKGPAGQPSRDDLIKEVRSRDTEDDRAITALAEAKTLGAEPRELAEAAHDRGKALYATPERATKFFQWAADADTSFAEPVFALARQAVVEGNVEETIRLLKEVKTRKGGDLLQEIGFDATWEIIKDDPEIRALL